MRKIRFLCFVMVIIALSWGILNAEEKIELNLELTLNFPLYRVQIFCDSVFHKSLEHVLKTLIETHVPALEF